MNHLSKVYNVDVEDLVEDVIAFATNQKVTHLDLPLLDNFELVLNPITNALCKHLQGLSKKALVHATPSAKPTRLHYPKREYPRGACRSVLGELTPRARAGNVSLGLEDLDSSGMEWNVGGNSETAFAPLTARYRNFAPVK